MLGSPSLALDVHVLIEAERIGGNHLPGDTLDEGPAADERSEEPVIVPSLRDCSSEILVKQGRRMGMQEVDAGLLLPPPVTLLGLLLALVEFAAARFFFSTTLLMEVVKCW